MTFPSDPCRHDETCVDENTGHRLCADCRVVLDSYTPPDYAAEDAIEERVNDALRRPSRASGDFAYEDREERLRWGERNATGGVNPYNPHYG